MKKKSVVRFLELSRPADLVALELKLNAAVRAAGLSTGAVRLFQHDDDTYGFQVSFAASPGKKKELEALYDLVMSHLPIPTRGRKRSPVRKVQAKYRITRDLHARIKQVADAREITASELVEECLKKAVGE